VFEPFGLALHHGSLLTWIVVVVPFALGALLLRQAARAENEVTT
jgi:branched-chain amino acid transport system permease protein